jgi:formate/nitrite transporter FocA (FNT family)
MEKVNRTAFLAGILIGIGDVIYVSVDNKYIGAMLFSFALLTVIQCRLQLYTGRIGFLSFQKEDIGRHLAMLVWNLLGIGLIVFIWLFIQKEDMLSKVNAIADAKFSHSCLELFVCGLLCGIMMFIAVYCKNTVITVFCADFPYFVLYTVRNLTILSPVKFLLIVLGNSVGAIGLKHLFVTRKEGESTHE